MRRLRYTYAAALALVTSSVTSVAGAEPAPADRALATALFNEARALVGDGDVAAACPKFAESQRLDPAAGTLLNLANCHELEGKTATAWSEFTEALAVAERERQPDRVAFARTHIAALEARLSRLVIVLPRELEGGEVEVSRDGSSIARVALGTAMPIDPGSHRIEVKAAGFAPWATEVEIADGARRELTVGPLARDEPALAAPSAPQETPAAPPSPEPAPRADAPSPRRTIGLATGGAGIVAIAVGSVAGVLALTKSSKSDSLCSPRCNDEGYALNHEAKTAADVSTVSFIVGAVALGAGILLYVTGGTSRAAAATSPVARTAPGPGLALQGGAPVLRF